MVFIDFVQYHYQIFQIALITRINPRKKTTRYRYKLAGNFKFLNYAGTINNGDYLLLVAKGKGFPIYIDYTEDAAKTYHFVQKKNKETQEIE